MSHALLYHKAHMNIALLIFSAIIKKKTAEFCPEDSMNNKDDSISKYIPDISTDSFIPDGQSQPQETEALKRYSSIVFNNQEENQTHNSYEEELRELASIENGDIEMLKKCWNEIQPKKYGKLAADHLRNVKNICIGVITLASRAAIRGGVNPEIAFSMDDSYVQQVEDSKDTKVIAQLTHRAELRFTELVREIKKEKSMIQENEDLKLSPHIVACKKYLFAHLHEKLTVTEIADHLGLNPNYLSDLFKKSEGTTILQYILREKIKLAKNMLIYSEYSYSDIAAYLGFSSQTHLNEHFKKALHMTLGAYRAKYKDKDFTQSDGNT